MRDRGLVGACGWALAVTAVMAVTIGAEATIESVAVVRDDRAGRAVPLGGLSDLAIAADGSGRLWATTDRGPNGTVRAGGRKVRTLLAPDFTPEIVELRVGPADAEGVVRVGSVIPLTSRSGRPLSGRPNGVGRDEPILDAASGRPVSADPDGVDPEGLVLMADGSFWMAEEYRPSLLRVSPSGRVLERFVPEGTRLDGADAPIRDVLPAAYGNRRDNRGFESIAVSPDGLRIWALLQSPLDNGTARDVEQSGNVRLLVFDPAAGEPLAEHVYRLGDPADPGFTVSGAAPDDGKLCALAAIDGDSLLALEQDDAGLARLYRVDLAAATDTLREGPGAAARTLEEIRDLETAGIRPVRKTLVADLAPLVPAMLRHVYGDAAAAASAPLKLEGMAMLGPGRIAVVNDNDFGINAEPGADCRSCVWVLRLTATGGSEEPPWESEHRPCGRAPPVFRAADPPSRPSP